MNNLVERFGYDYMIAHLEFERTYLCVRLESNDFDMDYWSYSQPRQMVPDIYG